jgi:hypothetical protein
MLTVELIAPTLAPFASLGHDPGLVVVVVVLERAAVFDLLDVPVTSGESKANGADCCWLEFSQFRA